MRNPYALPLRLRRQRLADLRTAIAEATARHADAADAAAALAAREVAERHLRNGEPHLQVDPWFRRQRTSAALLARGIAALVQRLEAHRADMRDELGQISALEQAEQRLLAEARRHAERRAQAVADDRAATIFLAGIAA